MTARRRDGFRERWSGWSLEARAALRRLVRRPAFAVTAILTLALSLGSATLLFSVTEGILLRPLPYENPGRVVDIYLLNHDWRTADNELLRNSWDSYTVRTGHIDAFRRSAPELAAAASYTYVSATLERGEHEEPLRVIGVDPTLFATLGVEPALGRLPAPEEYGEGAPVAVLRHDLWRDVFGGDPAAVGRPFRLDGEVHTVIGVMPSGFYFPDENSGRLWMPIPSEQAEYEPGMRLAGQLRASVRFGVGRLAPGVTAGAASAAVNRIAERMGEADPELAHLGARVAPALEEMVTSVRGGILLLFGAGMIVLLVACVNLANLVLVRGAGRRGELAVRAAIGASRTSLARAVFSEVWAVCVVGGALGLCLAAVTVDPFVKALSTSLHSLPRSGGIGLNPAVVAFTVAATLGTAFLAGVPAALAAARRAPAAALSRAVGRGAGDGPGGGRRSLLAIQVGLAALLLTGAGLLTRSALRAGSVDPGFDAGSLAWLQVSVPEEDSAGPGIRMSRLERVRAELARLDGVRSIAFSGSRPIGGGMFLNDIREPDGGASLGTTAYARIDPVYFRTLGIPLLRGRVPDRPPGEGEPTPAVVTERLARQLGSDGEVIGRRLDFGHEGQATRIEITGVAADSRHFILREPQGQLYLVDAALGLEGVYVFLHADGDPHELPARARTALVSILPDAEITDQGTTRGDIADSTLHLRTRAWLMTTLAVLAAVLTVVGISGVAAHFLAARKREVAVRMAMGADPGREVRRVLAHAALPAGLGLALGLGATLVLAELADRLWLAEHWPGLFYETSVTEPLTYVAVGGLLTTASLVAAWLPSRRATSVDPARILDGEG